MTAHRYRCVEVLMIAIVWSVFSISPVFAASQTVGTTTNPGDVQLVVDDLGSVRFLSNDSGVIQDQWFCPGTLPSNGVSIGFNDGTAKQFRSRFFTTGTVVTPVSNTLDGNKVITVYRLGSSSNDPLVTQETILDNNNRLYDVSWTVEVPSGGTSITGLKLVHGGDTNLIGNDYGFGAWKASSNTVSVHPDLSEGSGDMSLIGITVPQAYQATNYTAVQNNGSALSLSSTVSASTVDIGMAMQWNIGSLAAGTSVTIRSTVSLSTTTATATPTPDAGTPSATPTFTRTSTPVNTATSTVTPTMTQTATVSATPSVTPSATPTETPTVTETPTETSSPTITVTATVTPTFTETGTPTATPTFNVTPDPGTGGVAPPIFRAPAGGVTSAQRPLLTGTATLEGTVMIVIDGVLVGSAPVQPNGTFSFQLLSPLAVGAHEVKGKTTMPDLSESAFSVPMIVTVRREAVLDFDGDGLTDVTGHDVRGDRIEFRSVLSSTGMSDTASLDGWFPAPADYDGDGRWEYGAVGATQGALVWRVKVAGIVKVSTFGKSGDTALVGCRFGDRGEYAFATMRGRHVRYRTLNRSSQGAFSVDAMDLTQVLGCGDVDGDGIDELIVASRETRQRDRVTAVNREGNRRYVKNLSRFVNGFIAREVESGAPVLGALRGTGKDTKSSTLRALRGTFEFPILQLPSSLDVASGTFMRTDNTSVTSGIMWQRRGTRDVLRMLAQEREPTRVLKLLKGYRVTKPQDSRRVSGTRGRR